MGVVYRAVDPMLQRTVALKTVLLSELDDPDGRHSQRHQLLREARSAANLSHPNIVTVFEIGEANGIAYIAMEFIEGRSLAHLLRSEAIPKRKYVFPMLYQLASALDYAHSRGVVHRDIKPENVMIQVGGIVKIADFGIARASVGARTSTGVVSGTPFYMSPEQILGKAMDGRTDQYSLAVVSYQLLTGERPFTGETLPTLIYKILSEEPQPDAALIARLGGPIQTVLRRGLAKRPEDRFANCTELVKALEQAAQAEAASIPGA
jgi:serine/threonine protein kinase